MEFKEYSKYIRVSSGVYNLEVRFAGTDTVVLNIPGISLMKEYAYTAVAVGEADQGTLNDIKKFFYFIIFLIFISIVFYDHS